MSGLALLLGLALAAEPPRRLVFDSHVHVAPGEIDRLDSIRHEVGLSYVLNLSGMWPGGPLEMQLAAAQSSGHMLVAMTLPWRYARHPQFAVQCAALMREAKKLGARALKIEKALGLAVPAPDGKLLAVDDPSLDPIWATAGELGWPVVIHTGDPKAFWLPVDEKNERREELTVHPRWSNYGKPIPSFHALLEQQMRVVERHPKTKFVSVHFGNNAEEPDWVDAMLDRHPNLYVDIAARVPEIGRHDARRIRTLFIKHRRRILFGTDLGVSPDDELMLGSIGAEPATRPDVKPWFESHWRWLETREDQPSMTPIQGRWTMHGIGLPEDVLEDIYAKNALRLFGWPTSRPPYFRAP